MDSSESPMLWQSDVITITILQARNLKAPNVKAHTVNASVKVEFGEKILGESPKVCCTAEAPAEFNYNTTMSCTYDDPIVLDDIAHKPVVLTVIEQRERKTIQLGQCTVDMLPLVKGETKYCYTLTVNPLPGSPLQNLPPDALKPELDVMLSVNEPLVDVSNQNGDNLLTVTVESLFAPPHSWTTAGIQYAYAAALPVPVNEEEEVPMVFAYGALKPGSDKELPNNQKRWANMPAMVQGNAIYIQDQFISQDAIEDEDGDLRGKEEREHRMLAERAKNRVSWNTECRTYLQCSAVKGFKDKITKCCYWPLEVMRLPKPCGGKKKKDDDGSVGFHGVAFVNLAPLLYPGVKRIRGAYKVFSYTDQALYEKTKRKVGLGDDFAMIANNILNRLITTPGPKKGGACIKDDEHQKQVKIGASEVMMADLGTEHEGQAPVNLEGQQYVDSKSYIMFEICLAQPLIPKRSAKELAKKVAEFIPPNELYPKRINAAQLAVDNFHSQVANAAEIILDEFCELFGDELTTDENLPPETMESRRQKLIYKLNVSGKYFAFKERLKHAVVKIVREKLHETTSFTNKHKLQTFVSELYVYLMNQMNVSLNKTLAVEDKPPVPASLTNSAQLKHFAREAEVNRNFELAAKYHQERIARNNKDPSHWFDFGTFNLYIDDIIKAEECFKECIANDQKHFHGLLLYGVVCTLQEKHEAAETFFEAATCVQPKSILAWTMLGLYYESVQNENATEMAYMKAMNLSQQVAIVAAEGLTHWKLQKQRVESETSQKACSKADSNISRGSVRDIGTPEIEEAREETPAREPTPVPTSSIYMQAIDWLLEVKAVTFTERALSHELLSPMRCLSVQYHISLARVKLQKYDLQAAKGILKEAVQFYYENPDVWALMGHVMYLLNETAEARSCYERTIDLISDASEMHSVYLRLGAIYLKDEKFPEAKKTFSLACKNSPSSLSWLGVGMACYRLGEWGEAEDTLTEANRLNKHDPKVWGYLSLVCLKIGRQLGAEQSYKYAIQTKLEDTQLLSEIAQTQEEVGFGNPFVQ